MKRYWVISPNVKNNSEESTWKNFLSTNPYSCIGWGEDNDYGKTFIKIIKNGDVIINAQRKNWNTTIYSIGIVDENSCNFGKLSGMPSEAHYWKLAPYLPKYKIEKIKLDFYGATYNGDNKQIPAIYELHPDKNDKDKEILEKIMSELNMLKNLQEPLYLLKSNYNLILTGAPGTGKTFLAKAIAKEIINENVQENKNNATPVDYLENLIKSYESNLEDRKRYDIEVKNFTSMFPAKEITKINLDEYCLGFGQNTFCWWMEKGLKEHGRFSPGPRGAYVYGIYYSKDDEMYKRRPSIKNESSDEIALEKVLTSISNCVNKNEMNVWKAESLNNYWSSGFLLKVLNSYYPNEHCHITSQNHLQNIVKLFSLNCINCNDYFELDKCVFDFYRKVANGKDITPNEFMEILYKNFAAQIKDGKPFLTENINSLNSNQIKFVQFHPSMDYTDFVEGLRPIKTEGSKDIGFERKDGIFKAFCKEAVKNPRNKYVMIIDEINRGELSKIFGELFFVLDPDYRGSVVTTQYQNLIEDDDDFSDGFYVPENLYILGTMNDIDKSVESMDFAMRRRFSWYEVKANEQLYMLEEPLKDNAEEAKKRLKRLNEAIEKIQGLSSAYDIGPAYFLKVKNYIVNGNADWDKLWRFHIKGLLYEYLRGTVTDIDNKVAKLEEIYNAQENNDVKSEGQ